VSTEVITHKYLEIVKSEFEKYFDLIFEQKYEKRIFEILFKKYANIRYYNIRQEENYKLPLKDAIKNELDLECEKLIQKYAKEKVDNILNIFIYITNFDKISKSKNNDLIIEKIEQYRKEKLKLGKKTFSRLFKETLDEQMAIKRNFINKYKSDEFDLTNTLLEKNKQIYKTEMKYNIRFSNLYNKAVIKQAFETGLTNEDRLFVEYNLIATQVLEDIIKENFEKVYIIDFATTLLSKKAKLTRLLKIIGDDYLKENLILSINYNDFIEGNKEELYKIMRDGYKFAVILDKNLKITEKDIGRLEIFSYILVDEKTEAYKQISKTKDIADSIVKI